MKTKHTAQSGLFSLRILLCAAAVCSMIAVTLPATMGKLGFSRTEAPSKDAQRTLTFADRVAYQRAIEEVYWRHRIWPAANASPKPPLGKVMSQEQIERKVEDYLRKSQALEDYWQRPLTAKQLQAEMDRMAQHTRQPEILRELFAVLGDDPFVIAECLSRPVLAERLLTNWYAYDQKSKEPLESWLARTEEQIARAMPALSANYVLPTISDGAACTDDTWTATAAPPDARFGHTAVWTGSEMIIWGGYDGSNDFNTGYRYNPATDTWTATSTINAPTAREYHTAIWTGSEMIVWGGSVHDISYPNTGGRYNPGTDTWIATSTTNAPTGRYTHTAVWTGSEMIIWGGGYNTGGRYNPSTDSWTATSTSNAPLARNSHTAVWTGSEMIVWGGYAFGELSTGGRYNPDTDTWTPTSTVNAPDARDYHTAIWSGSEMIIWGGHSNETGEFNTGGKYDPVTDTWAATTTVNAPSARETHTAIWTGTEMIVWGGGFNSGGRYNPGSDSWTSTSTINAPSARYGHTVVWTGSEMIIWGGGSHGPFNLNTGGRYNPSTDSWIPTNTYNAPSARHSHTAIWTGTEMVFWGGATFINNGVSYWNTGGTYDPIMDSWSAISITNAPTARAGHTAVWTGTEMIIWGGGFNSGGRYNPGSDSWTSTSTINAPSARSGHTAVWTGSEMIIWGAAADSSGGRYSPSTDTWMPTSTTNAPSPRDSHSAVWTGSQMIVWGGIGPPCNPSCVSFNTGGRYNPSVDNWTETSIANAPSGRGDHTAIWTGSQMVIWGGHDFFNNHFNTGGKYDPASDAWTATTTTNAPSARHAHTAVWTGDEMILWGGTPGSGDLNTGGRYDPSTDIWRATNTITAPVGRESHTAVWTGSEMIVWGGYNNPGSDLNTGGRYCAQSGPSPTPTTTPTGSPTTTPSATATPSTTPSATPTVTATATATPTPTPTPTVRPACTLDGTLGTAPPGGDSGMLATRIFRFGTPLVMCGVSPLWPGTTGEGPYIYNVHYIRNSGGTSLCTTVFLHYVSGGIPTVDLQVSAFIAPFAASDISNSARYLGDAGVSTGSPPVDTSFQLTVPANTTIALVVYNVNVAPPGEGAVYQVILDQDIYCVGATPTPTATPTATVTPTATPTPTGTPRATPTPRVVPTARIRPTPPPRT